MIKRFTLLAVALLSVTGAFAQNVVEITNTNIQNNLHWTSDNEYRIDGYVFVPVGETLRIDAGTVIKAHPTAQNDDEASALIIKKGAKIMAEGKPWAPIIFTSTQENLSMADRGLWGGVIILGAARLNTNLPTGEIEGIPSDMGGEYGGQNDDDNSGVFRYVSIRHGGALLPGSADNEINGLTLGAVGRGTQIDHVEVVANLDDGVEFFGGTVNTKYLAAAFCGDDSYDYDEGFRGKGQFWFALQAEDEGGFGGEHDGGTSCETCEPYAIPVIYNATYIGSGNSSANTDSEGFLFRDNAGGKYYNSIFIDMPGMGLDIEDLNDGEDSRARLEAGDLVLGNNIWWNIGSGNDWNAISNQDYTRAHLQANSNVIVDPQLTNISRVNAFGQLTDGVIDPRPMAGGPAYTTDAHDPADTFYTDVNYLGAFGNVNWLGEWSYLYQEGLITAIQEQVDLQEQDYQLNQNVPNPASGITRFSFYLPQTQQVSLMVNDVTGKEMVSLIGNKTLTAGDHTLELNVADLKPGIYFYTLRTAAGATTAKMVVTE